MKKILLLSPSPLFLSLKSIVLPQLLESEVFVEESATLQSNEQNFIHMYEDYNKELYRYCFYRISSVDKALDIVQETFQRVWQHLQKGHVILYDKSFLYTIARNLIIDEYRKKKCISLDLLIGTELEPTVTNKEGIYTQVDMLYIVKCINQLPKTYRGVLLMRYIGDYSIKKIAKNLDISENVVSVRIFRGLDKLRSLIHQQDSS